MSIQRNIIEPRHEVTDPKPDLSATIQAPAAEAITKPLPQRIDLKDSFPITWRLFIVESLPFVLMLIVTVFAYTALVTQTLDGQTPIHSGIDVLSRWGYYVIVTICCAKIVYEFLCYLFWGYSIDLEHLTISRGLLFRSRSSFPIAKINDVSLHRTPIEILFGVYTLTILTASPTAVYGSIQGLPSKSAFGLQAYLLALLETTLPDLQENAAERILENAVPQSEQSDVSAPQTKDVSGAEAHQYKTDSIADRISNS